MTERVAWFLAGLVLIIVLAEYAPRIAGGLVFLLVVYLGLHALRGSTV